MPLIALIFALVISNSAVAAGQTPSEFVGLWVPLNASCQSDLAFLVGPDNVTLRNGQKKRAFGDLDFCYSCEGGVRYNGIVVWMKPEFSSGSEYFLAAFNAGEQRGVTKLDIQDKAIQRAFPLDDVALKKCP
ncbi:MULTISPECIES: hypothetical protein [Thiorhodovibrio]|uniref:hypothetical protein n=1 Tax=Thiorhodovibrio TaxID=61593 RepID=UPI001911AFA9|nr:MULTISPECIES: hypothetical protein [Thiorhodovibrio]MBK5969326.1 hypothetical protein [Thiorhodovibrio winogradskyi]WPL13663.1 hypothetical protein Thiosp_03478 [Thiorhodovibrio litoralis]